MSIGNFFTIKIDSCDIALNSYLTSKQLSDLVDYFQCHRTIDNSWDIHNLKGLPVALDSLESFLDKEVFNYILKSADGLDGEYVMYCIELDNIEYDIMVIWEN